MAYLRRSIGTVTQRTLDSPVLTTPALGTPASGVMTNMTGAVEASLVDNAVTLAKMVGGTDGNIISYDASGNPVAIATGSDGQALTSTGAGSPPAFEAVSGGKVLQVQSAVYTGEQGINSTTYQVTGLDVSITPSDTSSKIWCVVSASYGMDDSNGYYIYGGLFRSASELIQMMGNQDKSDGAQYGTITCNYLDSPSTDTSVTYYWKGKSTHQSLDYRVNASGGQSYMTLMEIGA